MCTVTTSIVRVDGDVGNKGAALKDVINVGAQFLPTTQKAGTIVDIGINGKDIHFIWLILLAQSMMIFSRTAITFIRNRILLHISTRINIV